MITKNELDKLVKIYEVKEFTYNDPSKFLRKYSGEKDIEIASFISALFAFGKREMFIKKLEEIFEIMGNSPYKYLLKFDDKNTDFDGFKYRFIKDSDLKDLLLCLKKLYSKSSLKELFNYAYNKSEQNILGMLQIVIDYFYSNCSNPDARGFKHLLPNPKNGSALKRLCMFLRWFVRAGEVDLGIWNFIKPSELIIPMDTHVTQQAFKMGLLTVQKADFKTAIELTNILKAFDENDPTKYDFALFGYGIEND